MYSFRQVYEMSKGWINDREAVRRVIAYFDQIEPQLTDAADNFYFQCEYS